MSGKQQYHTSSPFRAEQLRSGNPWQAGTAKSSLSGGLALETDLTAHSSLPGISRATSRDAGNPRQPGAGEGLVRSRCGLGDHST